MFPWGSSNSVSVILLSWDLSERSLIVVIFSSAEIFIGDIAALAVALCSINNCVSTDVKLCFCCANVVLVSSTSLCLHHLHFRCPLTGCDGRIAVFLGSRSVCNTP